MINQTRGGFALPYTALVCMTMATVSLRPVLAEIPDATAKRLANTRTVAALLPKSTIALVEITDLGGLVETVLTHPVRTKLESIPAYQAVIATPDAQKQLRNLQMGIDAFEGTMQAALDEALGQVSDQGVYVAFDGNTSGLAVIIQSSNPESLQRLERFVLATSQLLSGKIGMAKQGEYRGFKAYALDGQWKLARVDDRLLLTQRDEFGKFIIDQYLDANQTTLAQSTDFVNSLDHSGEHDVWAYVDVATIRQANVAPQLYSGKTDNVLVETLIGGIASNLENTTHINASLDLSERRVELELSAPHLADWTAPREYFFGEQQPASANPLIQMDDLLFAFSAHRDLSQMWLRADDLMTEKATDQLAQADAGLNTFFAGRDFGEDILGALDPRFDVIATAQSFEQIRPCPAIKLPAFAISFQMRTPEQTQPELRRVFQSFVGFLNVVGAMDGQPPLDLGNETIGDAKLFTGTFVPNVGQNDATDAAIQFNFSPTLAFVGDRVVLSSTTDLVKRLLRADITRDPSGVSPNSHAVLNMATVKKVLADNEQQLIAQNMLENGHSIEKAQTEIGVLLDLLDLAKNVHSQLDWRRETLRWNASLEFTSP